MSDRLALIRTIARKGTAEHINRARARARKSNKYYRFVKSYRFMRKQGEHPGVAATTALDVIGIRAI